MVYQIRCSLRPKTETESTAATAIPSTSTKSSSECRTIQINGKQHYLWRAVDQDGEVVDVYLQAKRDGAAAKRFFRRLLRLPGGEPRKIVTDKLRSYGVAHRELIPEAIHSTQQYENNRAEQSHEATRVRERGMRRFKSVGRLSDLSPPMLLSVIYSTWVGTWSGRSTIGI